MPILTRETTVRDISIYIFAISVVFNIYFANFTPNLLRTYE